MNERHVEASDSHRVGQAIPEVIHLHLFTAPGDARDLNSVSVVVRLGGREITLLAQEGAMSHGIEPVPAVALQTGGPEYLAIIDSRHELLAQFQADLLALAPKVAALLDDIRA